MQLAMTNKVWPKKVILQIFWDHALKNLAGIPEKSFVFSLSDIVVRIHWRHWNCQEFLFRNNVLVWHEVLQGSFEYFLDLNCWSQNWGSLVLGDHCIILLESRILSTHNTASSKIKKTNRFAYVWLTDALRIVIRICKYWVSSEKDLCRNHCRMGQLRADRSVPTGMLYMA